MKTESLRNFIEMLILNGRLPKSKRNDPDAILLAIDAFSERVHEYERNEEFESEEAQCRLVVYSH